MTADEFSAPLGQTPRKRRRKFPVAIPQVIAGVLALFLGIFVLWAIVGDDPFGGEPTATAPVDLRAVTAAKKPETPAAPEATGNLQGPPRHDGSAPGSAAPEKNVPASAPPTLPASPQPSPPANAKTITIIDGRTGARQEVVIPDPAGAAAAAATVPADQKLPTARAPPAPSPGR